MRDDMQQYGYRRVGSPNKEASHKSPSGRLSAVICAALILVTIAAYEPLRHNGFINLDDTRYVVENNNIHGGLSYNSIIWAFKTRYAGNWHPLTWLSHMLDCQLFGLDPVRQHFSSLLLHIANTLLLFWVLAKMTADIWPSAFTAALFALHPLHVESVAWAAERKDVLSTLFWMLTVATYLRYVRRRNVTWYIVTLVLFALGLMAKSMLVTLPFVLLLLDYWPLNRLKTQGTRRKTADSVERIANRKEKSETFYTLLEKLPLFALSAVSSVITFTVQRSSGAVKSGEIYPFGIRVSNALVSYVKYIVKIIYPVDLAVLYPHPIHSLPLWQPIASLAILIGISGGIIYTVRKQKYLFTGWLWYLGTLVPVIGLVQVGNQAMADRYTYLPSIGVFIMIAWGAAALSAKRRFGKIIFRTAAITALAILLICTRMQVKLWKNSFTLFEHTLKVTKNNYIVHNNYGIALSQAGRFDEGILQFRRSLQIDPQHANAHYNLGLALAQSGHLEEAVVHLRKSFESDSNSPSTLINLAGVLIMDKKSQIYDCVEAVRLAERACELTRYENPEMVGILTKARKAASFKTN